MSKLTTILRIEVNPQRPQKLESAKFSCYTVIVCTLNLYVDLKKSLRLRTLLRIVLLSQMMDLLSKVI